MDYGIIIFDGEYCRRLSFLHWFLFFLWLDYRISCAYVLNIYARVYIRPVTRLSLVPILFLFLFHPVTVQLPFDFGFRWQKNGP